MLWYDNAAQHGGNVQLSQLLKSEGFQVFGAESADKALGYVDENFDVVLSDVHMGDVSGIDLLNLWKKRRAETQFVLLTGDGSLNSAIEAIKDDGERQGNRQPAPTARSALRARSDRRSIEADEGRVREDPARRARRQHRPDPG
jgi:DNA-binding NtrC family response regulator